LIRRTASLLATSLCHIYIPSSHLLSKLSLFRYAVSFRLGATATNSDQLQCFVIKLNESFVTYAAHGFNSGLPNGCFSLPPSRCLERCHGIAFPRQQLVIPRGQLAGKVATRRRLFGRLGKMRNRTVGLACLCIPEQMQEALLGVRVGFNIQTLHRPLEPVRGICWKHHNDKAKVLPQCEGVLGDNRLELRVVEDMKRGVGRILAEYC